MLFVFAWLVVIGASSVYAEPLKPADREALFENLQKLQQTAQSNVDARFHSALAAYREAMASDDSAVEFHLRCTEKIEFEDKDRKEADFREWKKRHDKKYRRMATDWHFVSSCDGWCLPCVRHPKNRILQRLPKRQAKSSIPFSATLSC